MRTESWQMHKFLLMGRASLLPKSQLWSLNVFETMLKVRETTLVQLSTVGFPPSGSYGSPLVPKRPSWTNSVSSL